MLSNIQIKHIFSVSEKLTFEELKLLFVIMTIKNNTDDTTPFGVLSELLGITVIPIPADCPYIDDEWRQRATELVQKVCDLIRQEEKILKESN